MRNLHQTEEAKKAFLTGVYSTLDAANILLSDRGSEFTSKQFKWSANELGLIKVYTLPYTPTDNSVIEWTHFSEGISKMACNHHIDGMKKPI